MKLFQTAIVPTFNSPKQTVAASFATINGANSGPRFGVMLRYQDAQNYYLVSRVCGWTSALQISKVVNGTETVLKSMSLPNPVSGTFFRLEGQANGTTLTLKLDGVQKLSVIGLDVLRRERRDRPGQHEQHHRPNPPRRQLRRLGNLTTRWAMA